MTPDPLLEARNISCYRNESLMMSDVNFKLHSGELLQMVGPNGSGKTTLIRVLTGLFPPHSGQVLFRGRTIEEDPVDYCCHFYYLGHLIGVKNELTVMEHLQLGWRCHQSLETIETVLDELDLTPYRNRLCRYLSRGQCQRV